jgi:hypothetical protein
MVPLSLLVVFVETLLTRSVCSVANLVDQLIDEALMFGTCIGERGLKVLNRRISIALLPPSSLVVGHHKTRS